MISAGRAALDAQLHPVIAALFAEWDRKADHWTEAEFQAWLAQLTAAIRLDMAERRQGDAT